MPHRQTVAVGRETHEGEEAPIDVWSDAYAAEIRTAD